MSNKKTPDFEKSIAELESLVTALESGELSLEESLKTFEKGVQLTRLCQKSLSEAEQRVQILLQDKDGNEQLEDFDDSNERQ